MIKRLVSFMCRARVSVCCVWSEPVVVCCPRRQGHRSFCLCGDQLKTLRLLVQVSEELSREHLNSLLAIGWVFEVGTFP